MMNDSPREALLRLRDEAKDRAGSPFPRSVIQGYCDLETAFLGLARVSFLEDADIDGFFHNAYLAAAARRRLLMCVAQGTTCPPELLRVTLLSSIFAALASGERKVAADLAESPIATRAGPDDPRHEVAFAEALRLTILGRFAEAEAPFARFERARDDRAEDRSLILGGILKSDEARFNEGLTRFVAGLRHGPGEARLSLEAVGYARLGQRFGLEVAVADQAIPEELLGEPEAPYPEEHRP